MSKEAFPRTDDGRPARAEQVDRARGALSTARFGGAGSTLNVTSLSTPNVPKLPAISLTRS